MLLLFAFSCKKDNNANTLVGKWTVVSSTYSAGGPPIFFTANTPGPGYVQFGDSGAIQTNFFIDCIKYSASGNNIALTYNFGSTNGNSIYNYTYSIVRDTLKMDDTSCIEGCQVVLVKQ